MVKKLYWYVVYWRNKMFFRTKYRPNKTGSIMGMKKPANKHYGFSARAGFHRKTRTFRIVEKYIYLGRMTKSEFKKWIVEDNA